MFAEVVTHLVIVAAIVIAGIAVIGKLIDWLINR